ncbi:hypothetical protein OAP32_00295 [Crocinitomicaceae bacterium]|nr:hypothetical protein [Crocinitomicaceae bacterium]
MKALMVILTLLFAMNQTFAQRIKITCKDKQTFYKSGKVSNEEIFSNPDFQEERKVIDCDYTFDLNERTSTFYSRSLGGVGSTIPITKITQDGNDYLLEMIDHGRKDPSLKFNVQVSINTITKEFKSIYYDLSRDMTIAEPTGEITMRVEEME